MLVTRFNYIQVPFNNSSYGEITTRCETINGYKPYGVLGYSTGMMDIIPVGVRLNGDNTDILYVGAATRNSATLNQNVLIVAVVLYKAE